jgi:hypothetical protein
LTSTAPPSTPSGCPVMFGFKMNAPAKVRAFAGLVAVIVRREK